MRSQQRDVASQVFAPAEAERAEARTPDFSLPFDVAFFDQLAP